ncbi:11533_t:CDS:2, partial [Ambispora gerdemannii]
MEEDTSEITITENVPLKDYLRFRNKDSNLMIRLYLHDGRIKAYEIVLFIKIFEPRTDNNYRAISSFKSESSGSGRRQVFWDGKSSADYCVVSPNVFICVGRTDANGNDFPPFTAAIAAGGFNLDLWELQ